MSFSTAWRSWMHLLGTASPLPWIWPFLFDHS
jgi:hypothetical protein